MKYIVPMIVGSIIGYATNWLAIKMLFRPYYEKRIMGVKLPFTPGLIPKEKARIAKSIGTTVGEYLLSPEVIAETLSSEKTNKEIKLWIQEKTNKLRASEKSVKNILLDIFGDKYEKIIKRVKTTFTDYLISKIRSRKFQNKIIDLIRTEIYHEDIYDKIKNSLEKTFDKSLESEELEDLIYNKLKNEFNKLSKDERVIKNVLPVRTKMEIDRYLNENIEDIVNNIRDIVNAPEIQDKLKDSISNMVDQNVSRLITSFIPPESITEKIYLAINKYINDEDSNEDIHLIIKSLINKLMESKISDLAPGVSDMISPMDLSKTILAYIGQTENKNGIISFIDKKIKNIDKEKLLEDLSEKLEETINSESIYKEVSLLVDSITNEFLDKSTNDILNKFEENSSKIYGFIKEMFDKFIKSDLPEIIKLFNVSKIVEDEINKFDVKFTEKLILDIAQKELRAITRLGALLGAMMGLLSPFLQIL
ncbi:MAG: DUF445 family protein [Peptoniphilaceae bacterium]